MKCPAGEPATAAGFCRILAVVRRACATGGHSVNSPSQEDATICRTSSTCDEFKHAYREQVYDVLSENPLCAESSRLEGYIRVLTDSQLTQ